MLSRGKLCVKLAKKIGSKDKDQVRILHKRHIFNYLLFAMKGSEIYLK